MSSGAYNTYIYAKIGACVFNYNDSEHMVNLNVIRQINNCCLTFVLEIYDSTAYNIEMLLLKKTENEREIELGYGYCEDSAHRSPIYKGVVTKVTPHFNTTGESITLEGVAYDERDASIKGEETTYYGTPSEIVETMADEYGWKVEKIRPTKDPGAGGGAGVSDEYWTAIKYAYETPRQFIERALIPVSESENGKGDYQFIMEPLKTGTKIWYLPAADIDNGGHSIYSMTVGDIGNQVIEFTPNYNYLTTMMGAVAVEVSSIDSKTNETVSAIAYTDTTDNPQHVSTTYTTQKELEIIAKNVCESAKNTGYTADLVIVGDPTIKAGHYIDLKVMTQSGHVHPTSGQYLILSIEDLVDTGVFTSTLSLVKIGRESISVQSTGGGARITAPSRTNNNATATNVYAEGEMIGEFEMTAYCPCSVCCGQYSYEVTGKINHTGLTGDIPSEGRTIAVDPSVIPAGTWVCWEDPVLGKVVRRAEDCGGAIKGKRIDVYFGTHQAALNYGRRKGLLVYKCVNQNTSGSTAPQNKSGAAIVDVAYQYIGVPYVHGGKSPTQGFDCSGFCGWVINEYLGYQVFDLPWCTLQHMAELGTPVDPSDHDSWQPGDLLFTSGYAHVVMYIGASQVIHSPKPGYSVGIDPDGWVNPVDVRRYI